MKRKEPRPAFPRPVEFLARGAMPAVLLACLAFLVYTTSLRGEIVFDDEAVIFQNPQLLSLHSSREIFAFTDWRQPLYVTYGLNAYLSGLNPFGYHLLNVTLHAINAILVFYIIVELG